MMMINYFAMQIELGWITIEQVPKRFRKQVQDLLDLSHAGLQDDNAAEQAQKVKKYMLKPEFLSMILSAAVSLLTLFTF